MFLATALREAVRRRPPRGGVGDLPAPGGVLGAEGDSGGRAGRASALRDVAVTLVAAKRREGLPRGPTPKKSQQLTDRSVIKWACVSPGSVPMPAPRGRALPL